MFRELVLSVVLLVAESAVVRLLIFVSSFVVNQLSECSKRQFTLGALERLFSSVSPEVILQVNFLREHHLAFLALMSLSLQLSELSLAHFIFDQGFFFFCLVWL